MSSADKISVCMLIGGQGFEHAVDLLSARELEAGFDHSKYNIIMVGIDRAGQWHWSERDDLILPGDIHGIALNLDTPVVYPVHGGQLINRQTGKAVAKADVFFPVTDDPVQSFLRSLGVAYIGSDAYGSAVGRDKDVTKRLLRDRGIPIVPYMTLRSRQKASFEEAREKLGLPLFVKASRQGSSIGVYKVDDEAQFYSAVEGAFGYDRKILIEQAVKCREIGCAVLGNEEPVAAEALAEITNLVTFFDYNAKYAHGPVGALDIPAKVDKSVAAEIRSTAVEAFKLLECEGLARLDFFLNADGSFLINEINTSPGLGRGLMYPRMWMSSGLSYTGLLDKLVQLALERR